MKTIQSKILIVLFLGLVLLGISYLSAKNKAPDPTANWKTYINEDFNFSLKHPADFVAHNDWRSLNLSNDKEWGKSFEERTQPVSQSWIYISIIPDGFNSRGGRGIYNYDTQKTNTLLLMDVGESKSTVGMSKFWVYTRLPDIIVSGISAKVFVNDNPWDFPSDVVEKRLYVSHGNETYMIGGYLRENVGISENLFNQILSTFKFTNP